MANSSPFRNKGFLAVAGVTSLALLVVTVLLLKDRFMTARTPLTKIAPVGGQSTALDTSPGDAEPAEPELVNTEPVPETAARIGIILQDRVTSHTDAFNPNSPVAETFHTGDQVTVTETKTSNGATWYGIQFGEGLAWLDEKHAFVFDEESLFQSFVSSTASLGEMLSDRGQTVPEKAVPFSTAAFWLRAAANKNTDVASIAQRKLFFIVQPSAIIPTWMTLAKEATIKDYTETNNQLSMLFSSGRISKPGVSFKDHFSKLSPDAKKSVLKNTCYSVLSSAEVFKAAVETVGKEAKMDVFDELVNCVDEVMVQRKSRDYVTAGARTVLNDQKLMQKMLPKDRYSRLKVKAIDLLARRPSSQERSRARL